MEQSEGANFPLMTVLSVLRPGAGEPISFVDVRTRLARMFSLTRFDIAGVPASNAIWEATVELTLGA